MSVTIGPGSSPTRQCDRSLSWRQHVSLYAFPEQRVVDSRTYSGLRLIASSSQ